MNKTITITNTITKAIEDENIQLLISLNIKRSNINKRIILCAMRMVSAKYIKLLFDCGLNLYDIKNCIYSVIFDTHLKPLKFLFKQGLTVDDVIPCLSAVPAKEILEFLIEKGVTVEDVRKSGLLYEAYEFKFYNLVEYILSLGEFQKMCDC